MSRRFGASVLGALRSLLIILPVISAVGCGSSANLPYGGEPLAPADTGDIAYPDGGPLEDAAASTDAADETPGFAPKCAAGKAGKGNVCVRVVRNGDAPSYNEDSKALGLDGLGAVLVGLSEMKPGRELSFVAQTWYPGESAGAAKVAATSLPKVAEPLSVPPGTYYAFAIFRDVEPYARTNVAVGDYIPRFAEIVPVTVTEGGGINVDVNIYPARAIDVEVKMSASPAGNAIGPVGAWLLDGGKVVGEGSLPCADLREKSATVRVFTTYTGSFDVDAALFDFTAPAYDSTPDLLPTWSPGTVHGKSGDPSTILDGEWLGEKTHIDLSKVEVMGAKPPDPSASCY